MSEEGSSPPSTTPAGQVPDIVGGLNNAVSGWNNLLSNVRGRAAGGLAQVTQAGQQAVAQVTSAVTVATLDERRLQGPECQVSISRLAASAEQMIAADVVINSIAPGNPSAALATPQGQAAMQAGAAARAEMPRQIGAVSHSCGAPPSQIARHNVGKLKP